MLNDAVDGWLKKGIHGVWTHPQHPYDVISKENIVGGGDSSAEHLLRGQGGLRQWTVQILGGQGVNARGLPRRNIQTGDSNLSQMCKRQLKGQV